MNVLQRIFRRGEGPVEARSGYTDSQVAGFEARAAGGVGNPRRTGALETAAGFWGRSFSLATGGLPYLTPPVLNHLGRCLVRQGEALFMIRPGKPLLPVVLVKVDGGPDPDEWLYTFQLVGPTQTMTYSGVASAEIIHVRYSHADEAPWCGIPPWQWARDTAMAAGDVERMATEEARIPAGYVLQNPGYSMHSTVTSSGENTPAGGYYEAMAKLRGNLVAISPNDKFSNGEGKSLTLDRVGGSPPDGVNRFRLDSAVQLLAACGIAPILAGIEHGEAAATREAWRQFLHSTILPAAALVEYELTAKLGMDIKLSFDDLAASDIASKARAYGVLRKAEMPADRAERLAGFKE